MHVPYNLSQVSSGCSILLLNAVLETDVIQGNNVVEVETLSIGHPNNFRYEDSLSFQLWEIHIFN